jgi:HK97 family phage prohead protease
VAQATQIRRPGSQTARKIAYLYMHNMTEPIGHFTLLEERDYGLYFEAYIDEIPLGDRVLTQYESGTLNQHSIGFRYVWDKCIFEEVDGKEVFVCYELQLFEGSVVSLGANENTPFTGMKAEQMDNERKKLNAALDEAIKTLEGEAQYKVKQIISRYIALATEEPGKPLTRPDEPQEMDYGKLLKSLTN